MSWRQKLLRVPGVALAARAHLAWGYVRRPLWQACKWLFTSRETTNLTYHLTPRNRDYLAAFVAGITGTDLETCLTFLAEIDGDEQLKRHVREKTKTSPNRRFWDAEARLGRRLGWYAFVRALKPGVVVETGVEKGLGACVLAAALLRNRAEGFPGIYYGTDIDPEAGYLFDGPYREAGQLLIGDSITSLKTIAQPIDLFINDSEHSADYERREYETVHERLSPRAVILGDNAHVTSCLFDFARGTGRQFAFFREEPANHWYPGAGIGVAFSRAPLV
jgi:predicted O-methyltransferase YrrM